jgi:protein-S-isoprenylcysteine O-methyltransferase Ste14
MPESVATGRAFEVAFLAGLVAAVAIRVFYTWRTRRDRPRRGAAGPLEWSLLLLSWMGLQVVPLVFIFTSWLSFADYDLPAGAGIVGTAVLAVGVVLLWRSHADLGPNWTPWVVTRGEQTLVTNGVYRRMRHPMYAAHLLLALAQPLMLWNWIAGPGFLVAFVPLCLLRVPREEEAMLRRFGDDYRRYMDRTGRVIPSR